MGNELVTDVNLLQRLAEAAKRKVSAHERRQQRLSFVYGNLPKNSDMTKSDVARALRQVDQLDGKS
ncbi:MAG: hypothetical protein AAGB23_09015 [Pseudomonadota bacterium]